MAPTTYRTADVDGFKVFYREAGTARAPKLLLLHGFPSAGHMFRDLIPLLADRFHIVAPDLPGFGQSDMPSRETFRYTFDNIAKVIERFTEVIGFDRFAVYVFDYGAPTGFRLALNHPERITAIISQNGNAYEDGLSDGWTPIKAYWQDPSPANREALRGLLRPDATRWQYTRCPRSVPGVAGRAEPRQFLPGSPRLGRRATRPVRRLQEQRRALSVIPGLFPHLQTTVPGRLGQERSVLHPARRRGVQARQSQRSGSVLRHRTFRTGNAREGNRGEHSRVLGVTM